MLELILKMRQSHQKSKYLSIIPHALCEYNVAVEPAGKFEYYDPI